MDLLTNSRRRHSRRDILKSSALAMFPLAVRSGNPSLLDQQPMTANGGTERTFAYLSFQRSSGPVQHLHRAGHRQPRKPCGFWQPYDRLRRDAGRVWGARAPQQGVFTHI
jgi:hypothetical protein